jgi:N-acetylglucosaminyldiphosphoundecaprenol N-acetyl-beta-D-mannosaminyltransferase
VSSVKPIEFPSVTLAAQSFRPARANVLGVGVHAIDLRQALEIVHASIDTGKKGYVCVTGVHGVMEAQRSPEFRRILDDALLVTPDGMPTVWVGRLQGHERMRRVFGPDLMLEVCRRSVNSGHTHFLCGGKPGVAEQLGATLSQRFPGLRVVGTYTPPFRALSAEEEFDLIAAISNLKPSIIWVGMSTPRQESFMSSYIQRFETKLMIGVGAAFDLHTGKIKDAPHWMKQGGLQWLHRLCQEPSRLWKRYLVNNSSFAVKLAMQMCGARRYKLAPHHVASRSDLNRLN